MKMRDRINELANNVSSREDLHEKYKKKLQGMLYQFTVDLYSSENFDPKDVSLACLRCYAEEWVDLHCKME